MEGVTQPAVTQLVNRLERRGWVERHTDERDARAVLVALTAAGQAALDSARAEFRALLHEEMAALGDDEVETLAAAVDILDRLIDQIGGARRLPGWTGTRPTPSRCWLARRAGRGAPRTTAAVELTARAAWTA